MRQLRVSWQTFTYDVIMALAKTHDVRGDANSGGSPCRHQWGADTRAAAGAAAAIADRMIMAKAITS